MEKIEKENEEISRLDNFIKKQFLLLDNKKIINDLIVEFVNLKHDVITNLIELNSSIDIASEVAESIIEINKLMDEYKELMFDVLHGENK